MVRRTIWAHTLAVGLVAASAFAEPVTPEAPSEATPAAPPVVGVTPPEVLRQVPPEYPEAARAAGLAARVTLRLDIDQEGKVTHAEVVEPQGHGFDEAALRAAEQLLFRPAARAQRPIAVRILFHYDFKLEPPPAVIDAGFEGRVAIGGPAGSGLSGAHIELRQNGVVVQSTDSDAQGAFQLEHLPAGAYQVSIARPGFLSLSESVQLQAGQAARVSYALEPQPAARGAIEVRVQGERLPPDVSYHRVASRELGHVAGNRGDALQALENLPGVARPPTLSGLLIVHGTSPESSQIFIDGTYVPSMYHFGGLTSVVPTDMLDHVDFFTGNYGVRYGRGNGGIVDIAMRKVRADGQYHGLFQADLLDARLQLEGPLPATEQWSFIGGVRRSHVDLWLIPLLESQDTSFQAAPVYYDYQAFVQNDQGGSHLRFGVFGSDDRLRLTDRSSASGGQFDQASAFWNVQLLHEAQLGPGLEARTVVSFGYFLQRFSVSTLRAETLAYPMILRSELSAKLSDRLELRLGPDLLYAPLRSRFSVPEETGPNSPDSGSFLLRPLRIFSDGTAFFRPAFFVELQADPLDGLHLIPGVRVDYTGDTGQVDVSPRLSAKYELARAPRKTTLKGAFGYFYEPPQVRQTLEGYGTSDLRSVRALQSSLGIEQQLSQQLSLSVEGFHLDLGDLITRRPQAAGRLEYQNTATGNVLGAELLLRYEPDERFFGWLSYTLSRSERRWGRGESEVLFDFDQTHILAAVASLRIGRGWELGARLRAVSGNPATPCISGLYSAFENGYLCLNGAFQSVRSAPFYQLDLRLEKRWQLAEQAGITAYLEVINATARENKDAPVYSFDFSQRGYASSNLPLLPNLGARFDF
jgi:TonB family protein